MSFFPQEAWRGQRSVIPRLPECGRCGLYKLCHSPKMEPQGRGKRTILFVGEAPGEQEDRLGTQLIGKSGQHLRKHLERMRVKLDDCHKTNAIICRPPGNKIQDLHIECCRPNLIKAVRDIKPSVIVLLGGSSVKGLLPAEREADIGPIARWVGWRIPSQEHRAWICPTYHPAYLLRMNDRVLERMFKKHLRAAIALEDVPVPEAPLAEVSKQVEIVMSIRDAALKMKDLARKKGLLSIDYETTGIKPDHPDHQIASVGVCFEGTETWAAMYGETLQRPLRRLLRAPGLLKIASNLKMEERWSRAKVGTPVRAWYWDTMLAAHVLDNRPGICSLKFQTFVHFGIADYEGKAAPYLHNMDARGFNKVFEVPPRELLLYNGLDALFEYQLTLLQRKQMSLA